MRISKPQARWFPVPKDPDEASILIKHLSPGEIQDIVDKVMVQEIEYAMNESGDRTPILRQTNNRGKDRQLTILACAKDWKKFYDSEGKALAFTEENVLLAIREINGFSEFVGECREQLDKDIANEREAQKKT